MGGSIDGADVGRLLPEDQFHQVGGDEQVRIGQDLVQLRGRNAADFSRRRIGVGEHRLDRGTGDDELGGPERAGRHWPSQRQQFPQAET